MSDEPQMTPEEEAQHQKDSQVWTYMALCLGFNELAKLAKSLGEKIYFRLQRDHATKLLVDAGGNGGKSPFAEDESVITIEVPGSFPWIRLRASDVELMRAYVAEQDRHRLRAPELPLEESSCK